MVEYRRFVSYLYGCEDGRKGKNAGFVRVEVRDPQVILRIGLQEVKGEGQAVLLSAGREPVALGPIRRTANAGGERFRTALADVQGSGWDFHHFSGLRIHFPQSGRCYQTFWDDRISPENQFAVRKKTEGEAPVLSGGEAEEEKEGNAEGKNTQQREHEAGTENNGSRSLAGTEKSGTGECETGESETEGCETGESETGECEVRSDKTEGCEAGRNKNGESDDGEAETEKCEAGEPTGISEKEFPGTEELAAATTAQSVSSAEIWREEPRITWDQLQNIYPKMLPFGAQDPWEVLRIHLQDIGRLPREYWIFGHNDFVLQGYEDYHHLLLIRDPASGQIFLGVSGDSLERERRVAELFGFRRYRPAEPQGYWLTRINL